MNPSIIGESQLTLIGYFFSYFDTTLTMLEYYKTKKKKRNVPLIFPELPAEILKIKEGKVVIRHRSAKRKTIGPFDEEIIDKIFIPFETLQNRFLAEQKLTNFLRPFLYNPKKQDEAFVTAFKKYEKIHLERNAAVLSGNAKKFKELANQEKDLQDEVERHIIRLAGRRKFAISPENWRRL